MTLHGQYGCPRDEGFGLDKPQPGETRVRLVIALTAITMLGEIAAGMIFGSMALLADGLHMGSHAAALLVAAFAYAYARRRARDPRYSFGTGKVNALGGFTGALLLGAFALLMAWESVARLVNPVDIAFDQAIVVAVIGLVVNAVSAWLLRGRHDHGAGAHDHGHDHNLRSAYLHVIADALTSVLAIAALTAGKLAGLVFLDPFVGIVGAIVILVWARSLVVQTTAVLLDRQAPDDVVNATRAAIEADESVRVLDLHLWSIGSGMRAAAISVAATEERCPDSIRAMIPENAGVVHATIEVHRGLAASERALVEDSRADE